MRTAPVVRLEPVSVVATYTEADLAAAYRDGYGDGADAMQLERARKPWLTEDEALELWLTTSH